MDETEFARLLGKKARKQCETTPMENPSLTYGSFVELGSHDKSTPTIVQVQATDTSKSTPLIIGRTCGPQHELQIFQQPGKCERSIDPRNGSPIWRIYHPAAKLVCGSVSGAKWFYDTTYRSETASRQAAERTLSEWRQRFDKEICNKQRIHVCLCPHSPCPHKQLVSPSQSCTPTHHASEWRIVPNDSLEHLLSFLPNKGASLNQQRQSEVNLKAASKQGHSDPAVPQPHSN